ncbi:dual specificity protein phosphatase family protein [Candidatus Poribacteria bacterium]|nr:dual specificity protein phosphatase family protein [Candidatus Poribacteria bacterium]
MGSAQSTDALSLATNLKDSEEICMWLVWDSLFLGGRNDAASLKLLKQRGITHIVNCACELPCYFPDDFEYLALRLDDPDAAFVEYIEPACQFIDLGRQQGNVLVHCTAAVSRGPSVVLAYLCHLGYSLETARELLDQRVPTNPDLLFLEQLRAYYSKSLSP